MDAALETSVAQDGTLLVCKECGRPFWITSGESEYYRKHSMAEPKRCKECREKRREPQSKYDGLEKILKKLGDTDNAMDRHAIGVFCCYGGFR